MIHMVRNFSGGEKRTYSSEGLVVNGHTSLQHFDLSRNTSLRTLETTARPIDLTSDTASDFFITILSSVTSPVPLNFVVIYQELDFGFFSYSLIFYSEPTCYFHSPVGRGDRALHRQMQFRMFREMHRARDFRLVLCVDVFDSLVEHATKTLECLVEAEKAKGGLDHHYGPLIISERRTIRTRPRDRFQGEPGDHSFTVCAL